jgi:hypothetical protein
MREANTRPHITSGVTQMTFKRAVYASTLAAGVGLAGLIGIGLGTALADGPPGNAPGAPR